MDTHIMMMTMIIYLLDAAAAVVVAPVGLVGCDSSDSLSKDGPKCGSNRCEASISP